MLATEKVVFKLEMGLCVSEANFTKGWCVLDNKVLNIIAHRRVDELQQHRARLRLGRLGRVLAVTRRGAAGAPRVQLQVAHAQKRGRRAASDGTAFRDHRVRRMFSPAAVRVWRSAVEGAFRLRIGASA